MRRLLAVGCALGLVAGGMQAATYEEPRLTAREVASRARGVVRVTAEAAYVTGDRVVFRAVTNGVADLERHTTSMRAEFEMTPPLGMAPHDVVTAPGRVYMRSTGDWVTFPLDTDLAPGLVSDPLVPLTAPGRATAWRRVSPARYTTEGPDGGRMTIRLTLREYGVGDQVEVPAGARPVKDIDEALGVLGL